MQVKNACRTGGCRLITLKSVVLFSYDRSLPKGVAIGSGKNDKIGPAKLADFLGMALSSKGHMETKRVSKSGIQRQATAIAGPPKVPHVSDRAIQGPIAKPRHSVFKSCRCCNKQIKRGLRDG